MKVDLLKGEIPLPDVGAEKVFGNGAYVRVSFNTETCFIEILKTFKNKQPELLSVFSFNFDGKSRSESVIFHTDYVEVDLHCLLVRDFFVEYEEFLELSNEFEDGISVIHRDRVVNISGDKRVLKVFVIDMVNGNSVVGEIKFLKSLKFQQGKSAQNGKYSDAFLTRTIGIPKATLSRWKTDKGWRKNVYELINKMELPGTVD